MLQIQENETWNWVNNEETANGISADSTESFRKEIERLKNENSDLIAQLEQLDFDNLQNVSKVMEVKQHLQNELEKTKETYSKLQQHHNFCIDKEKSFQQQINHIRSTNENEIAKQKEITEELRKEYQQLLQDFQKLTTELNHSKNSSEAVTRKQENISLAEFEAMKHELGKAKEEITNIQDFYEKEIISRNQMEDDLRNKNVQLLKEFQAATQELASSKNELKLVQDNLEKEREEKLKLLDQSRVSYVELQRLYESSLEKGRLQQEELESSKKLYNEGLIKLKQSEDELKSNYESFLNNYDKESQNLEALKKSNTSKAENSFTTGQFKTNCEELTDCDLQDSSLIKDNSSRSDGYSSLERLLQSHFRKISSLEVEHNTEVLQELKNGLILLEDEIKLLTKENELVHSKYCNDEMFRDHINNAALATLSGRNDVLKETKSEITEQENHLNTFVKQIREIFEEFRHSAKPEFQEFPVLNPMYEEVTHLFKEMYAFMYELKTKVILLSDSNINIITEKNQEIEKLLEKSEQLSLELIEKSQTIRECENEINELSKNNDLLIADLEVLKNNHLETISEIDEDKTILLEEQLENANIHIKELQDQLEQFQENNNPQGRLDLSNSKIEEEDNSYLELLNKYDELQIEYDVMKKDYASIEQEFQIVIEENKSLKSSLDSSKTNSENLLYLQDELKTLNESLQSDIEMYKEKIDVITKSNNKLKTINEENYELRNEVNSVREMLNKEEQLRGNLQNEVSEITEKLKISKMTETSLKLQYDTLHKEYSNSMETVNKTEEKLNEMQKLLTAQQKEFEELKTKNEEIDLENKTLKENIGNQEEVIQKNTQLIEELQQKVLKCTENQESNNSNNENSSNLQDDNQIQNKLIELEAENCELKRQLETQKNAQSELIQLVTTKHQENIAYHNEIQRLNQILNGKSQKSRDLEIQLNNLKTILATENQEHQTNIEKLKEENMNLKEQCDLLSKSLLDEQFKISKLREEQSNPSEAEISLKKKLERLQTHLIELEEHYTRELYEAEQKNLTLQAKVNEIEEREKSSSTMYTSVSIRANQQVESLQNQLQAMTNERDSLRKQISDLEDTVNKQTAALTNLQLVLEKFRKGK